MPTTIGRFFLRILLWVPPAFMAWYVLVPLLHWPIRWFLSGMALLGVPEFVTSIQQTLHGFEFLTSLAPGSAPGQTFRPGATISAEVDARLYSDGTALMAALTLAAWHPKRGRYLWYGWLMLLPLQMLAVFAAGMKQILLNSGPGVIEQSGWSPWQLEIVAYLYQFSTLIMPPVTALAVWIVLHRAFVEKFIGADMISLLRVDKSAKAEPPAPRATPMPKRP